MRSCFQVKMVNMRSQISCGQPPLRQGKVRPLALLLTSPRPKMLKRRIFSLLQWLSVKVFLKKNPLLITSLIRTRTVCPITMRIFSVLTRIKQILTATDFLTVTKYYISELTHLKPTATITA